MEGAEAGETHDKFFSINSNKNPVLVAPTLALKEEGTGYVLTGTKQKIKSGKFAKCNANLIWVESWPHISVLKKYTKSSI